MNYVATAEELEEVRTLASLLPVLLDTHERLKAREPHTAINAVLSRIEAIARRVHVPAELCPLHELTEADLPESRIEQNP